VVIVVYIRLRSTFDLSIWVMLGENVCNKYLEFFWSFLASLIQNSNLFGGTIFVNISVALLFVWIFFKCNICSSIVKHSQWYLISMRFFHECYIEFFLRSIAAWLQKKSHSLIDLILIPTETFSTKPSLCQLKLLEYVWHRS
jgi:hypothetical protein